jgi:hypothetical protein
MTDTKDSAKSYQLVCNKNYDKLDLTNISGKISLCKSAYFSHYFILLEETDGKKTAFGFHPETTQTYVDEVYNSNERTEFKYKSGSFIQIVKYLIGYLPFFTKKGAIIDSWKLIENYSVVGEPINVEAYDLDKRIKEFCRVHSTKSGEFANYSILFVTSYMFASDIYEDIKTFNQGKIKPI